MLLGEDFDIYHCLMCSKWLQILFFDICVAVHRGRLYTMYHGIGNTFMPGCYRALYQLSYDYSSFINHHPCKVGQWFYEAYDGLPERILVGIEGGWSNKRVATGKWQLATIIWYLTLPPATVSRLPYHTTRCVLVFWLLIIRYKSFVRIDDWDFTTRLYFLQLWSGHWWCATNTEDIPTRWEQVNE